MTENTKNIDSIAEYRVKLETFQGPLDLLLYLVREHELEIRELPISLITDQYLEYLEVIQLLNLNDVGDFLVMATTLMEIKSRMMIPPDERPDEEVEEDPRLELIEQLLEYKRYKDAAGQLMLREMEFQQRGSRPFTIPNLGEDAEKDAEQDTAEFMHDVELWDLFTAFSKVIDSVKLDTSTHVTYDETPVKVYIDRMLELLLREKRVPFVRLFNGKMTKVQIIGNFIALLELVREKKIRARQVGDYGEIELYVPEVATPEELAARPLSEPAPLARSKRNPWATSEGPADAEPIPFRFTEKIEEEVEEMERQALAHIDEFGFEDDETTEDGLSDEASAKSEEQRTEEGERRTEDAHEVSLEEVQQEIVDESSEDDPFEPF